MQSFATDRCCNFKFLKYDIVSHYKSTSVCGVCIVCVESAVCSPICWFNLQNCTSANLGRWCVERIWLVQRYLWQCLMLLWLGCNEQERDSQIICIPTPALQWWCWWWQEMSWQWEKIWALGGQSLLWTPLSEVQQGMQDLPSKVVLAIYYPRTINMGKNDCKPTNFTLHLWGIKPGYQDSRCKDSSLTTNCPANDHAARAHARSIPHWL